MSWPSRSQLSWSWKATSAEWKVWLQKYNLSLDVKKTEYMNLDPQTDGSVNGDRPRRIVTCFKYLGSHVSSEGGPRVKEQFNTAWSTCGSFPKFCVTQSLAETEINSYCTTIRPTTTNNSSPLTHDQERWNVNKRNGNKNAGVMLRRKAYQQYHKWDNTKSYRGCSNQVWADLDMSWEATKVMYQWNWQLRKLNQEKDQTWDGWIK